MGYAFVILTGLWVMGGKLSRKRRYLDRFAVDERKAVKNPSLS
ncbi:hypothetical protein [Cytobacillus oceanisediminis]|nr:hypothetical protein [Cytobacillus oceanisediminis]